MKEEIKRTITMRNFREWLVVLVDLVSIAAAFFISILLTFAKDKWLENFNKGIVLVSIAIAVFFIIFVIFRIFKIIWRYAGTIEYLKLGIAIILSTGIVGLISLALSERYRISSPRFFFVFAFLSILVTSIIRLSHSIIYYHNNDKYLKQDRRRTLIIGGGDTARIILSEIHKKKSQFLPVCIVDDSEEKINRFVCDIPVVGVVDDVVMVCRDYKIQNIILAIPSLSEERRREIIEMCLATGCEIKVLPLVSDIIENIDLMNQARDVNIEDLLSREPVNFDLSDIKSYINKKNILITGAGGSIGSELCRQISKCEPNKVFMLDIYENTTYDIQQELKLLSPDFPMEVQIFSMTDRKKLEQIFKREKFDIVFHAAAHKHVPLMETNPEEAVKNNVFGTKNIVDLCFEYQVSKMLMISTDKAVNPTNIMGATKRLCEMIMQQAAQRPNCKTQFASVRFGNVLGSNGSVIPLFRRQILNGGPVTVTDKEMIRYFMTIPEAVSLVLQAGKYAKGGEIFVLDMGQPVKILTLAENMIRLMGFKPYSQIPIECVGLRPGEKLYEELLMKTEGLSKTNNNKIFIGNQTQIDSEKLDSDLNKLKEVANSNDGEAVIEAMQKIVLTYKPNRAAFKR